MKVYLIILICFLTINSANALKQKNKTDTHSKIRIQVFIDKKLEFDTLRLFYNNHYWPVGSNFKSIEANSHSKNHNYLFELMNGDKVAYISLEKPWSKTHYISFFSNFISEVGDDVKVLIEYDSATFNNYSLKFSGKGAAKYECQYELMNTAIRFAKIIYTEPKWNFNGRNIVRDSLFYSYFTTSILNSIEINTKSYIENLSILERYRSRLGKFMYDVLKAQIYGELEDSNYIHLTSLYSQFPDEASSPHYISEVKASLKKHFLVRFKPKFNDLPEEARILSSSYLYSMIRKAADTIVNERGNYAFLRENFKGLERDRLVAAYLTKYFFNQLDSHKDVANALTYVKTDYCRDLILSLNIAFKPGQPAFNFKLPDTAGKIRTLDELKGKVVIMDFWFTGCSACRNLKDQMTPIVDEFKLNKQVIFVSISIDENINEWKKSVKEGKYTHAGSVDLSTKINAGKKIIEYYKIFGYPTLILIDKEGKIISGNPPKPSNKSNLNALKNEINKAILN